MRLALYYPHTEIQSVDLLRSALLLWDEIAVVAPWDGYRPTYQHPDFQRAFELIGRCLVPSETVRKKTHEFVEDFATRQLPPAFRYAAVEDPSEAYEVYPQKLLPETWGLLQDAGLAGAVLQNADYPVANPTGLTLMSMLADCCAGTERSRVTDRGAAYSQLASLLRSETGEDAKAQEARESLIAVTLKVVDLSDVQLKDLVSFREREETEAKGYQYRELRHRYLDRLESAAARLALATTPEEVRDIHLQFSQDMKDDLRDLRDGLQSKSTQLLGSKEMVTAVVAGAAALGSAIGFGTLPLPEAISVGGGMLTIGALLASKSKFAESRIDFLKKHPMAYLYEARGGFRY